MNAHKITTYALWTDWRGREHECEVVATYELRAGKPHVTGWTAETSHGLDYADEEQIVEQLHAAIDDELADEGEARAAESYVPAQGLAA